MPALVTIRLARDGKFLENPDEFVGVARKALNAELLQGGLFLEGKLRRATPTGVTSNLRRSWHTRQIAEGQVAVENTAEYFLAVEEGRKAAPVPIKPLELWVRRKLGLKRPESLSVARRISWYKSKHRTPGQNFAYKTIQANIPLLERLLVQKIQARLVAEWGKF